jgi:hypothetical protein
VYLGGSANPAASGHVWLVANCWGYYPGVLVATVRNGRLENRPVKQARCWEDAYDYKVVVGISERAVADPSRSEVEDGYRFFESGDYLRQFAAIYVSAPLGKAKLGADWPAALSGLGDGDSLFLPRPARRTIRLLFPDGSPLKGATFAVALYGTSQNHCGAAAGIDLGSFQTDAGGEVSLVAANAPLALRRHYWEEEGGGARLVGRDSVITDSGQAITVRKWWDLSEYDYRATIETRSGDPIAGAHLLHSGRLRRGVRLGGCGEACLERLRGPALSDRRPAPDA